MEYATTDPDQLAEAMAAEIGREVRYGKVETDGASKAAGLISELI